MRRRDLWETVQEKAALGQCIVLTERTLVGVDVFMWFGNADDGEFIWYSLPGTSEIPPQVASMIMGA